MNKKSVKHALAALLVFCMVVSMLPISALAATNVTPKPAQGNAKIPVEYFTSTLYNWNQKGANNATAEADYKEGREETYLQWSILTRDYINYVFYAGYAVKVGNNYYPAYGKYNGGNSYSVYYRTDGATNQYYQNTNGQTLVATYDVPDTNVYITDPTRTLATETVDGTQNVIIFYGASEGGHYEKKGFYFTDGSEIPDAFNKNKDNYPVFSKWQGGSVSSTDPLFANRGFPDYNVDFQNFYIYTGLAADDLSTAENAPFNNDTVNAADLFGTTEYNWKQVYQNVNVPYYLDDNGYYVLDSDKYAVYFADGVNAKKDGATMEIADQPACYWVPAGFVGTGFLPFNNLSNVSLDAYQGIGISKEQSTVPAYVIKDEVSGNNVSHDQNNVVYGFGMVTEVKFQMTDDGLDEKGNPITFEFAGDDDVWVFIDNKLALDVGGTHDAIKGTINFATGDVELTAPAFGRIGDIKDRQIEDTAFTYNEVTELGDKLEQQNLYGEDGALGTTLTGFSAQGEHTLKIYYMERGRGRTNCLIRFNLPQRDVVEVTKKLDSAKDSDGDISAIDSDELATFDGREYGFTLYENGKALANKTYYVYDANGEFVRMASTDENGHFTLHRNETARFMVEIDEEDSFYVVEDEQDPNAFRIPTWTYTTNIGADNDNVVVEEETAKGFTGMTVTAYGNFEGTRTDTISFVCENFISTDIGNPGISPQGERIVIDYGLPITINVSDLLANDIIRGEQTTVSLVGAVEDGKLTGDFGTAVYNNNNTADNYTDDTITYTLNKQLTGIETLTYQITVTGTARAAEETATATAKVQIMPATSMYYEENFGGPGTADKIDGTNYIFYGLVSYSDVTTKWEAVKDSVTNRGNQETGFVGTRDDSTYGSDVVYLGSNDNPEIGDSYGTSMHASTTGAAAQFVYDFTGTGTAIYGRVSQDTGYIRVVVTNKDTKEEVDRQFIDTVEIANVGSETVLYNIPIYLNNTFGHGTYHVEVLVYKVDTPTERGGAGADFYLDGIRIYNPVVGNETVNTAYADDTESNTVVMNIRDKIIGDIKDGNAAEDDVFTLTDQYGTIIDNGELAAGDAHYGNYAKYGPNNEFYLNNSDVYTVSFKLINWNASAYTLYLGMKAPAGKASVTVGGKTIELNNSTECYYNINDYVIVTKEEVKDEDGDVVESYEVGTVTISGNDGLASLTNIKVTGVDEFTLGTSKDIDDEGDDPQNGGLEANVLYMVPRTFSLSAEPDENIPDESIPEESTPDESIPEESAPEESIPEDTDPVFTPGSFKVTDSYIKLLKRATFMVTASKDVSYITVNGVRVDGSSILNSKLFTYSVGSVKAGTVFEIVAYNKDGVASEPYTITAK